MSQGISRFFYIKLVAVGRKTNLRRFRAIDNLNTYIRRKLRPEYIITKRHNFKVYLDELDSLHLSVNKDWEPFQTNLMERIVKEGDTVLDIGANIGFDTLMLSKLVGEKGRVYAFEPDPITFELAKKNLEANNIKNVELINKAVSHEKGEVTFYRSDSNTSANSMSSSVGSNSITVDAISLDEYFGKDFKVDFIKIDVEGAEGLALKGMENIIKNSNDLIFITEYSPLTLTDIGKGINLSAKGYLELLEKLDFKFFDILERKSILLPVSIHDITKKYTEGFTNLLCIKKKNSSELRDILNL
jgi:FkbM family methyltransferase